MRNPTSRSENLPGISRRMLLKTGALAALLPWGVGAAWAADSPAPNAIPPAEALKRIMQGNARYVAGNRVSHDFQAGRAARTQGQHPIASILSCADSRVAPELVFDQGQGDLFVARVAGNVLTPTVLASLEYGTQFLGVPLILVLGHTGCGAVDAAIKVVQDEAVLPGHLPALAERIRPAVEVAEKAPSGDLLANACAENVRHQVGLLKEASPIVSKFYAEKKIDIVGALYNLPTGEVTPV
ncbi:MAG TPA: carbonic anhydrase [Myxococcales bacterium]|nr:carbonic anhydrase [Myxococcales bacterium]